MPPPKSLCKIDVGADYQHYLLTTAHEGGKEGFDLTLCDGNKAWKGSVLVDDLETMSRKMKMKTEDYISQTHKALTAQNVGGFQFQHETKRATQGKIQFIWKKNVPSENIKFQLGSVTLAAVEDPTDTVREIFNFSINMARELKECINTLETDNQRLSTERAQALKRLEKCVTAKEDLEKDLYSKFVGVVNEKKAKIRHLKSEVDEARAGIPSTSAPSQTARTVDKSEEEVETDEEEEKKEPAFDEMDTEDEDVTPPKRIHKPEKGRPKISQDDSLQLDMESEEEVIQPTARRRHRQLSAKKEQTPSRPVIPKGSARTPKASTPSTSRTGSALKKSFSNNSNRSSDNIDIDDLMDDF